ncbi:hypothetical protein [Streptomyces anulatus]|uniref:hypothetical protein n=1 Tax=Streptomyces anulatus TaxID=1892 RepID=UPI00068D84A5|nr:hypothetical protein [Streptomyces anulatus]
MRTLGWITPTDWREVRYGTPRTGAVDVPMFTTSSVAAVGAVHPEVDWEQLCNLGKGRRFPLTALVKALQADTGQLTG